VGVPAVTTPIVFRPEADEDVEIARDYYERQALLGQAFLTEVERAVERIAFLPIANPELSKGVRWYRLRRFPYVVYYRTPPGLIEILAVLHGRRGPAAVRRRTK
jgi:toxin ParE1/3/4